MAQPARGAIIVGVSGASSSGKTTLSRLLQEIFPNSFIMHEDDFSQPESALPMREGLLDWDCVESLVIPDIITSLEHIQRTSAMPSGFESKENRNDVGERLVSDAAIADLKAQVSRWSQPGQPGHGILSSCPSPLRLCFFDGFLLYTPSLASIQPYMDIKLFLQVSRAKAKERREARSGYVTIEGFWEDPPLFFDKIVWPNYVAYHKWMFEGGDVEGKMSDGALNEWNVKAQVDKKPDVDVETTLRWSVETLMKELAIFAVS